MSKKQKRQVSTTTPKAVTSTRSATTSARPISLRSSAFDFNPDYTHVKTDLKRIATIIGSFVVVLIGLSFFLK
jgi:hypothetical protein